MAKNKSLEKVVTKSKGVPVTHNEFHVLKKMISSLQVNHNHKFQIIDKRFEEMNSRIDANFHKMLALLEEQNSRNKVVMDAQGLIMEKLFDHDHRIQTLEKAQF